MKLLPITRLTLYKHGLGSFMRQGEVRAESLQLSFPRNAMNDVLKSLVASVSDVPGGVLGLNFETPEDRNPAMQKPRPSIDPHNSLVDYLSSLRGRRVRCVIADTQHTPSLGTTRALAGQVLGLQLGAQFEHGHPAARESTAMLLLKCSDSQPPQVEFVPLAALVRVQLEDADAAADLEHLLRVVQNSGQRETAQLQLDSAAIGHTLHLAYIAPAPAWRVSYRLISSGEDDHCKLVLQGWGLFDNTLDEDLEAVELSLIAGMPVSFEYLLHEPHTPSRKVLQDQHLAIEHPIAFSAGDAMPAPAAQPMRMKRTTSAESQSSSAFMSAEEGIQAQSSGESLGALFAYHIDHKVSVKRGSSAMVPLLNCVLRGRRALLFNERTQAKHPIASLRFKNTSGASLERGPLTVYDQSPGAQSHQYAGEAVLAVTQLDAEMIVAYAVELGIEISSQQHYEQRRAGFSVQGGQIFQTNLHFQTRRYFVKSARNYAARVTIEHPRTAGYEVIDDKSHTLKLDHEFARFEVEIAAFSSAEFKIIERYQSQQHLSLDALDEAEFERFVSGGELDAAVHGKMSAAFKIRKQLAPINQALQQITQQRDQLSQQQKRARENLAPLNDSGAERELRARFAAELGRLETALQALEPQEQSWLAERNRLLAELNAALS